eukprot:7074717-Alexandrium_andersonii.AAC.1
MRKLRTAVIGFVDPKFARCRNPHAALGALASCGAEVDPGLLVGERRLLMFRRHLALFPDAARM